MHAESVKRSVKRFRAQPPYYLRVFLSRCQLAQVAPLASVFSIEESNQLHVIHTRLSESAVALLARLQRRRRVAYFRLSDVAKRYSTDFSDITTLFKAAEELKRCNLLVSLGGETTWSCSDGEPRKCYQKEEAKRVVGGSAQGAPVPMDLHSAEPRAVESDDSCLDPLWALLSLSMDEIGVLMGSVGGVAEDMWKKKRAGKSFAKRDWIIGLHHLCSKTQTLTSKTLYSRVIECLAKSYGDFVSIPLVWRRMFQKLDIVETAPMPDTEAFETAGSFALSNASLLCQCKELLALGYLPPNYFIERSSFQSVFAAGSSFDAPLAAKHTQSLFPSMEAYNTFSVARFIQKAVEEACSQRQFGDVLALSEPLEALLHRFIAKRAAAREALASSTAVETSSARSREELLKYRFASFRDACLFEQRFNHPFLCRFTCEWVCAVILFDIVKIYESFGKDHQRAVDLLELLLATRLIRNKRQKMYNRLTVNWFVNLRQPQMALEAAVNAFRDSDEYRDPLLPLNPQLNEIAHRLIRILKACFAKPSRKRRRLQALPQKHQKSVEPPQDIDPSSSEATVLEHLPGALRPQIEVVLKHRQQNEERIPRRVVCGNSIIHLPTDPESKKKGAFAMKAVFLTESDATVSVEQFALEWYLKAASGEHPQQELLAVPLPDLTLSGSSWVGVHDEGSLVRELFGVLMAGPLFDSTVPDVFITTTQVAPLDLFSERFYLARKASVDTRLQRLSEMTPTRLFWETFHACCQTYPKPIVGVSWDPLSRVFTTHHHYAWWVEYKRRLESHPEWKQPAPGHGASAYSNILGSSGGDGPLHPSKTRGKPVTLPLTRRRGTARSSPFGMGALRPTRSRKLHHLHDNFLFLAALAAGIGARVLTAVFQTLTLNYSSMQSGLPDLTLWRTLYQQQLPPPLTVLFSEVKSENDRLSEKQRQWLGILLEAGAHAEVFSVQRQCKAD